MKERKKGMSENFGNNNEINPDLTRKEFLEVIGAGLGLVAEKVVNKKK